MQELGPLAGELLPLLGVLGRAIPLIVVLLELLGAVAGPSSCQYLMENLSSSIKPY
jgi:hypothetical protein